MGLGFGNGRKRIRDLGLLVGVGVGVGLGLGLGGRQAGNWIPHLVGLVAWTSVIQYHWIRIRVFRTRIS